MCRSLGTHLRCDSTFRLALVDCQKWQWSHRTYLAAEVPPAVLMHSAILHRCCRSLLLTIFAKTPGFSATLLNFATKTRFSIPVLLQKSVFPGNGSLFLQQSTVFVPNCAKLVAKRISLVCTPADRIPSRSNCQRAVARPRARSAHRRSNQQNASSAVIDYLSIVLQFCSFVGHGTPSLTARGRVPLLMGGCVLR